MDEAALLDGSNHVDLTLKRRYVRGVFDCVLPYLGV
jgi:hypothetical protein